MTERSTLIDTEDVNKDTIKNKKLNRIEDLKREILFENITETSKVSNRPISSNPIEEGTNSCVEEHQIGHVDYDKKEEYNERTLMLPISKKVTICDGDDFESSKNKKEKKRAIMRRPSRSKAAITARRQQKELEEKAEEQMLRELTSPRNLTRKEKSLLQRAFSLGITKFVKNNKIIDKITPSSSSRISKTSNSSKKRKQKNMHRSSSNSLNQATDDTTPSMEELQWYFRVPEKETIEEHPFNNHLLS